MGLSFLFCCVFSLTRGWESWKYDFGSSPWLVIRRLMFSGNAGSQLLVSIAVTRRKSLKFHHVPWGRLGELLHWLLTIPSSYDDVWLREPWTISSRKIPVPQTKPTTDKETVVFWSWWLFVKMQGLGNVFCHNHCERSNMFLERQVYTLHTLS